MLGAHTLLTIPPAILDVFLAAFFLAMIPLRRIIRRAHIHLRIWHMAFAGALAGFLTGLVLFTGPLSVPVFSGSGMSGGAFLGSEAASAILLYAGKLCTFGASGVLIPRCFARTHDRPCVARWFDDREASRQAAPNAYLRASH
ncbi:hypothetical protein [Variovorax sp. RA8]|uniref:hypothetical protein n=1 Tax=Variovorax sp. (strain JCM 16519 / RA8) TaxID=662548 RepID=UPI000AE137F3|nr:hypothetical protein [Variovorax sp. RA8]